MPRLFRTATSTPCVAQLSRERANPIGRRRREAARAARMQRNQIHERATLPRERRELNRMLLGVVHAAEHHVLERHAPVEHLRRLDDVRQRILRVDRHQLATQPVVRRVDRDRETELLRSLAERDDARQHADRRDRDVARADAERRRDR